MNQTVSGCTSGMLAITVDNPLGVATIEFEALTYYPNPVREQLSISNRAPIQKITTYNNQGKILFEQEIDNTEVNIDFSSYAAGTYFVKMGTANGIKTIKITKN